jgi:hypothetical protein
LRGFAGIASSRKADIVIPHRTMRTTHIFSGTAALFLAMSIVALWHSRWVQRLPTLEMLTASENSGSREEPIRCSGIVAARNEEARIEQTVRHLLAQRGLRLEWPSRTDGFDLLQSQNQLQPNGWTDVERFSGTGETLTKEIPATEPAAFYRLER